MSSAKRIVTIFENNEALSNPAQEIARGALAEAVQIAQMLEFIGKAKAQDAVSYEKPTDLKA